MKKLVLTLIVGYSLLLAHPLAAQKMSRIGTLVPDDLFVPAVEGFKKKMAELGYVEGRNITYDSFNARGDREALERMAQNLARSQYNVIVTSSTTATVRVAKATEGTNTPVVFLGAGNPLEFVKGYASSGRNISGVSASSIDLVEKRLELLKELVPGVKRVASLNNPQSVNYKKNLLAVREGGKKLGLAIVEINASNREELTRVTTGITRKAVDAIFLPVDATIGGDVEVLATQSMKERLPMISPPAVSLERGVLASYGPDFFALGQQGAVLVDKILKGALPMDLPIEQPVKLKLAISLKTAKEIGLNIPREILLRADKVIE